MKFDYIPDYVTGLYYLLLNPFTPTSKTHVNVKGRQIQEKWIIPSFAP